MTTWTEGGLSDLTRERDAYKRRIETLEAIREEHEALPRTVDDLRVQLRDAYEAIGRSAIGKLERIAELEADLADARRALADRKLGAWVRLSDRIVVNLDAYEAIVFEHKLAKLVTPASSIRILEEPGELDALRRACARMVSP